MSFIDSYIQYTANYESPSSFWKWSAYTIIASILRDNCYCTDDKQTVIYPNIYVLLLATSAEQRKGQPVGFCEKLVEHVENTKVISGRSSIQAILDELKKAETNKTTGKILNGGSALFSVPELSAGIVNDPEAIKILTDIYDFRAKYTSRLRGTGTFEIKNVCFTMLAASNEDLLKDVYDTKALFGGLLGRTFLIVPDEFRKGNSLLRKLGYIEEVDYRGLWKSMEKELHEIAMMVGQFKFTDDAIDAYESWYLPFREGYRNKTEKSGVTGRIHTSIIKLAMILAAIDKELIVRAKHIFQSIDECIALLPNYQRFLLGQGKSPGSEVGVIVLNEIYDAPYHTLSKKIILQRHWNDFDPDVFEKLIATLCSAGMVSMTPDGDGVAYTLTKKCLEILFKDKK